MNLHDHFQPPLSEVLQWNSFHSAWLTVLATDFNRELPPKFYAEPSARFGIEVDVAALERISEQTRNSWHATYSAPAATATIPFAVSTDELEVLVHENYSGEIRLVGAVEFVSPANKDRPQSRAAFVAKCREYLQRGVGVLIVDLVGSRHFNLHDELLGTLGESFDPLESPVYAVAYRTSGRNGDGLLSMWTQALNVGRPLPELPMCLLGGITIPARLNETYAETCRILKVAERLADRNAP